jgi:hypothetical protein
MVDFLLFFNQLIQTGGVVMGDVFSAIFYVSLFLILPLTLVGFMKKNSSFLVASIICGAIITLLGWLTIGFYLLLIPLVQMAMLVKVSRQCSGAQFAGMLVGAIAIWLFIGYLFITY